MCNGMVIGPLDPSGNYHWAPKVVQTLWFVNHWTDSRHLKFYHSTWSLDMQRHMLSPVEPLQNFPLGTQILAIAVTPQQPLNRFGPSQGLWNCLDQNMGNGMVTGLLSHSWHYHLGHPNSGNAVTPQLLDWFASEVLWNRLGPDMCNGMDNSPSDPCREWRQAPSSCGCCNSITAEPISTSSFIESLIP